MLFFLKRTPPYKCQTPQNLDLPQAATTVDLCILFLFGKSSGLRTHCAHTDPRAGPLRGQDRPPAYIQLYHSVDVYPTALISKTHFFLFFCYKMGIVYMAIYTFRPKCVCVYLLLFQSSALAMRHKITSNHRHKGVVLIMRHRERRDAGVC